MSNFTQAYAAMLALIADGVDIDEAQVRAADRFDLDEDEAEGLLEEYFQRDDEGDHFRDDVEADADVLRMAGFGMDEEYSHYSYESDW